MSTRVDRGKIRGSVRIAAEVSQKRVLDAAGNPDQLIDRLIQTIDICRIWLRGRVGSYLGWNVGVSSQAVLLVESNDRLDYGAAEEAAAVIVNVEPKVDSRSKRVSSVNPRDVVHELRRSDRALRVGREAVRPVNIQHRAQHAIIRPDGNLLRVRKVRVGLAERELKREAVESSRELIHQRG